MGKEKRSNHRLEQEARGQTQTVFADWVVNSLEEDYAFDFEIRPTERWTGSQRVTPAPCYAQLKASGRFDDEATVWWDLDTDYLQEDCLRASVPVVLIVYERRSESLHWCVLQRHCWDVLDDERPKWREQSTVRITIERDPLERTLEKLRNAISNTQRRLSMREHIATSRRLAFDQSPAPQFATTEQVRTYKTNRLNEAVALAERDQIDTAREKFMQLYQLPEDDESTIKAIAHLLELREMDDPSVAFGKLRFAIDGIKLAAKYGDDERLEYFEAERDRVWEYLEDAFVGSRYTLSQPGRELLVLDIVNWGNSDGTPIWAALVQYGVGELDDEAAQAIAGGDQYQLVETGESRNPREDACSERNHSFDTAALRDAPGFAICTECGLSHETLEQWLTHDVPFVCDQCGTPSYDTVFERDESYCADCR